MGDKTPRPSREQIVLEYLSGGVTYRQLEAKYGLSHSQIQRWVMIHLGQPRDRAQEYMAKKNTNAVPAPVPAPEPPSPPADAETVSLAQQLQLAQLKISLLEEVLRIAQTQEGLVVPKKYTTKLSKLSGKTSH